MFVNPKVTIGQWKLGCLITFKARHKVKKVLLTESKWNENITETALEATIRNNKVSLKPKAQRNGLFLNCTAVSFNKGNAYILFCIFTRNYVTENLIKLKQDEQMMIREKHMPEEITGPLTPTTELTSWPTHGAHPFHGKSPHKRGAGALEVILSFPNTKAPHVLQLHGCMVFGGIGYLSSIHLPC